MEEMVWEAANIDASHHESDQPLWFDQTPAVRLSNFESWNHVAKWAVPLYELTEPSSAYSENMSKLITDWRNEYPSKEGQVVPVRFVQDKVGC